MDQKPSEYSMEVQDGSSADMLKNRHTKVWKIISIVVVLLLSGFYLLFAWNKYQHEAGVEAIMLVESLESIISSDDVAKLSGGTEDLTKTEYTKIRNGLTRLAAVKNPIKFAYLLSERDDKIIFLVDSESPESPDYSPPGQVYEEADDTTWEAFRSGKTVLSEPAEDRWGTWISTLTPIKDPSDGRIIAILGIDYSASEWYAELWKRMVTDVIIVICVLMLFFVLLYTWNQNSVLKILSRKLAYGEALYRSVFNQAPIGIAIVNDKKFVQQSELGQLNINPMFEQIIGRKSDELKSVTWTEITHPEDLAADLANFEQFQSSQIDGYSMEKRFLRPNGATVWTNMKISQLQGIPDEHSLHICLLEDISLRKLTEDSLKESERSKSVLLANLPGLAYRCNYDSDWTMQYVSAGCFALTGYQPESLLYNKDLSFNDLISSDYREKLWMEWERILAKRLPFKQEYEITTAAGEKKWVLEMGEGVFNEQGKVIALEGIVVDISEQKKYQQLLEYNSEHDRWTGLWNRYYLENMLNSDNLQASTNKRAIMSINMGATQELTKINGFHYTQELIKKIAEMLSKCCSEKHLLFHTFIDRFVFYLKDYQDTNELYEFCKTIESLLEPLLRTERVNGAIGVIEVEPGNKLEADLLLKKILIASEKALDMAEKHFGICFYDAAMEAQIMREEAIKCELARITDDENNQAMFLLFQPILDLQTDKICAFEALARVKSEKFGMISPLEFIPIAEKTKLIIPLGQRIIKESLQFLNTLKANGFESVDISINVSAIQLLQADFVDNLLTMINDMQVKPDKIALELTESVFSSNYEEINNILGKLREIGIHIAIDDFGTGYSSFARERELKVNCLKIDKHFIDRLMESNLEHALTSDIISMAHKMGHYVVAEGVEYEQQKQYLLANGCDKIQGYLISRPIEQQAAIELLRNLNSKCE